MLDVENVPQNIRDVQVRRRLEDIDVVPYALGYAVPRESVSEI